MESNSGCLLGGVLKGWSGHGWFIQLACEEDDMTMGITCNLFNNNIVFFLARTTKI